MVGDEIRMAESKDRKFERIKRKLVIAARIAVGLGLE